MIFTDPAFHIFSVSGVAVTFSDLIIRGAAGTSGAAIYNEGGSVTVLDSEITNSIVTSSGGAVYNSGGSLTISNSQFVDNYAASSGGAVYNNGGSLTISNSQFVDNYAASSGGAIYSTNNGTLTIAGTLIDGNRVESAGGGIYMDSGVAAFTGITVAANAAATAGGGLFVYTGTATLKNSTFSANSAALGGAIHNTAGVLNANNITVAGNAAESGGGVSNSSGVITLGNSLIGNNAVSDCAGVMNSNGYNLVENVSISCVITGETVGNILGQDPQLEVLTPFSYEGSTHPLLVASPAINAGNNATCETTDQRGIPRPVGPACDIGAFEYTGDLSIEALVSLIEDAYAEVDSAQAERAMFQAMLLIMDTMNIGVYSTDGQTLVAGGERGIGDFYLYEIEIDILAQSMLRGDLWTVNDIARQLTDTFVENADEPLLDVEVQEALVTATVEAVADSGNAESIVPLLIRELGLLHQNPYDSAQTIPLDQPAIDALQRTLIIANLAMYYFSEETPIEVAASNLPQLSGNIVRESSIGLNESDCPIPVAKEVWKLQKKLGKELLDKLKLISKGTLKVISKVLDGIHGSILGAAVTVEALDDRLEIYYGAVDQFDVQERLDFRILVQMEADLGKLLINCGWLAGMTFPPKGPISGVPVEWIVGNLTNHIGTISGCEVTCAPPLIVSKTGPEGIAHLYFTPKLQVTPATGLRKEDPILVQGLALYQLKLGNILGTISSVAVAPTTGSTLTMVSYREPDAFSGTITYQVDDTVVRDLLEEEADCFSFFSVYSQCDYTVEYSVNIEINFNDVIGTENIVRDPTKTGYGTVRGVTQATVSVHEVKKWDKVWDGGELLCSGERHDTTTLNGSGQVEASFALTIREDGTYEIAIYLSDQILLTGESHQVLTYTSEGCADESFDRTTPLDEPRAPLAVYETIGGVLDSGTSGTISGNQILTEFQLYNMPAQVEWNISRTIDTGAGN
ncbi:MAG: hypothetical protein OHK0046_45950 [Anaerolineae bacterium]